MSSSLWKGEGAGNDFILGLGSWANKLASDESLIRAICDRRRGIGADGVLALFKESETRVRLVYRNADGSRARFCANGARVAALAAHRLLETGKTLELQTDWARIPAVIRQDTVMLHLPAPETGTRRMCLGGADNKIEGSFLILGIPHFLIEIPEEELRGGGEILASAGALRKHPDFGPEGANISLISRTGEGKLRIRTFERGVPEEVLSCGSAMASAGWIYGQEGGTTEILPASGDRIRVSLKGGDRPLRLEGPARLIARIEEFSPA